jgi:hypothetical protein
VKDIIEVNDKLYLRLEESVERGESGSVVIAARGGLGEVEVLLSEIRPLMDALAEAAGELVEAAISK